MAVPEPVDSSTIPTLSGVFAPVHEERDDYVTFCTDVETLRSDWLVLGASDVAAGPVATVELPFRVPAGLHGNWFSSSTR